MGLFGSLYTSALGMNAASRGTQGVSENIANMTTVGYKRSDTAFSDMVSSTRSNTNNNKAGGVGTTQILRATVQGQMQQTDSSLDAGITGRGFFAVSKTTDGENFAYTRNGQFGEFVEDPASGSTFLRNSAGFYLYGWPIDLNGNVASGADTSSLQPVETNSMETASLATTTINMSVNLRADETNINPQLSGQQLPASGVQGSQFNRSVTVYDANGDEHPITFQYRKITGPMAQFSSNNGVKMDPTANLVDPLGDTPGILDNDTMTITDGTETLNITFVDPAVTTPDLSLGQAATLNDVREIINAFTGAGTAQLFDASVGANGQLLVRSVNPSSELTVSASNPAVLGSNGFSIPVDPVDGDYTYAPDHDIIAGTGPYVDQANYPALENTTDPNPYGWWEVSVVIPDPANPNSGNTIVQSQGLMNFNSDGTLNAADGTETITLDAIDFDSSVAGDELSLSVNVGRTSQFSGNYDVIRADQNGAPVGERTGVYISDKGIVKAKFSNGVEIDLYQIPLATFANAEGLNAENGTVFTETGESGAAFFSQPGEGGAGEIYSSTLENSNVDLSNEMSYLIVYQRTFGLNSQVINAVDEMTQNLSQLKR